MSVEQCLYRDVGHELFLNSASSNRMWGKPEPDVLMTNLDTINLFLFQGPLGKTTLKHTTK